MAVAIEKNPPVGRLAFPGVTYSSVVIAEIKIDAGAEPETVLRLAVTIPKVRMHILGLHEADAPVGRGYHAGDVHRVAGGVAGAAIGDRYRTGDIRRIASDVAADRRAWNRCRRRYRTSAVAR